jgi:hypothetical protein
MVQRLGETQCKGILVFAAIYLPSGPVSSFKDTSKRQKRYCAGCRGMYIQHLVPPSLDQPFIDEVIEG